MADSSECVRHVVVLGSTGSIGQSALEVIGASGGRLRCVGLSAHSRVQQVLEQARRFKPKYVVLTDPQKATADLLAQFPRHTQVLLGAEGVSQMVADP